MFIQFLRERLQKVTLKDFLGVTATAVILTLAYLKIKSLRKHNKVLGREPSQIISQISQDTVEVGQCSQRDFARVINSIKKHIPEKGKLNLQGIKAIYMGQIQLSRQSFDDICKRSRQTRRDLMPNLKAYKQAVLQLEYSIEDLHNNHLNALLAHFKINNRDWYEMIELVQVEQSQDWEKFILDAQAYQLDFLRQKEKLPLSIQQLTAIFKYKTEVIKEIITAMKEVCQNCDRNQLFSVLDRRMSDLVYLKFKEEEENINYALSKLSPLQHKILQQIQQKISGILQQFIEELQNI